MTTQQMNKVNKLIEGKTFDDLVEIMEGLENAGAINIDIEMVIMNRMDQLDSERFIAWDDSY